MMMGLKMQVLQETAVYYFGLDENNKWVWVYK
jgi:hypothetical protein